MIFCVGDSFTFGDELPDLPYWQRETPSQLAWPSKLESLLGVTVVNRGKPACANSRIIKRAIDATLEKKYDIVIVAWSNPDRYEFIDQHELYSDWPGRNPRGLMAKKLEWHQYLESRTTDDYFVWSHRRWLRDILLLQAFFTVNNQKYLMVQSHQSQHQNFLYLIHKNLHNDLADHIDTKYFPGWPCEGFVEWIGLSPRGPNGHPLELGHQKIAEKINEYIRNLGWIS